MQNGLNELYNKYKNYNGKDKLQKILIDFNKINIIVAKFCNHKKNVTKNYSSQIANINNKINLLKDKLNNKNKSSINKQIKKLKLKLELKKETKDISTSTSKINYIDPRILISFIKKFDLSLIDKIFSKKLQNKYKWAFNINDFKL